MREILGRFGILPADFRSEALGVDFIVPSVEGPDYVFIEANERPGLANHEPQPTAQRFIDLLFPLTMASE